MLGAIQAVREGTFGVNRAALEYGVPKTTLNDRISGRVVHRVWELSLTCQGKKKMN